MTVVDTSENRGPLVNVGMWIMLVPTVVIVAVKVYTKWSTSRNVALDNVLMCIAMVMSIVESIAITESVRFGLGRRIKALSAQELQNYLITQYVASMFYILSIYMTKLSTLSFYSTLCAAKTAKRLVKWSMTIVSTWTSIAVIVLIFQCGLPEPWNFLQGSCVDMEAFWSFNVAFDVVTQVVVSFFPFYLLRLLRMPRQFNKWLVSTAFTPNILTVPLTILRITYLFRARHSDDLTYDSYQFSLLTAIQSFAGVILACLPFIKPVLDSLILQPYLIMDENPNSTIANRSTTIKPGSSGRLNSDPFNLRRSVFSDKQNLNARHRTDNFALSGNESVDMVSYKLEPLVHMGEVKDEPSQSMAQK